MSDREEIIDVITRLFVSTDRRDWQAVIGCLERHVHFDMSSLTGSAAATLTAQQIAEGWEAGLEPIKHVHHQAGNFLVDLHGAGSAHALCYAIAYHYRETKSGRNTRTFVGSYDFDLHRREGHWRIASFKFNLKFVEGNPNLEQG